MISQVRRGSFVSLLLFTVALGCAKGKTASAASSEAAPKASATPAPSAAQLEPVGPAMHIDPNRAWLYVKEILAFGPRWDGSKGQQKLGEYLHAKLKADGAQVEDDSFVAETPAGKIPMRNIIAKFPDQKMGSSFWVRTLTPTTRCATPILPAPMTALPALRCCWPSPTSYGARSWKATACGWRSSTAKSPSLLRPRVT